MSSQLKYEIIGESKSGEAAFRRVSTASEETGKHLSHFGSIMGGVFGGLALAEGAAKVVDFLKESVNVSAQDQAAQVRLEQTLHNVTGATKEHADAIGEELTKMAEATGFAKGSMFTAYQQLAVATHSTAKAHADLQLAMNVSAGTGRSLTQVSLALAKAQNGSVSGLQRLGIATKDARGKTMTLNEIMGKLSATFKGQAEAHANTLAGQMSRLKVTFEEFQAKVGEKVIPILTELGQLFLNKLLPAIGQTISWIETNLGPKLQQIFAQAKQVFSDFVTLVMTIWHQFGSNIVSFLKGYLSGAIQILKGAFQILQGLFEVIDAILTGKWSKLWKGLGDIVKGAWNVIGGIVKQGWAQMQLIFEVAGRIIGNILSGVWSGIVSGWNHVVSFFGGIGGKIKSAAVGMWDGIVAPFKGAINAIISAWDWLVSKLHIHIPSIGVGPLHTPGFDWSASGLYIQPLAKGGIVMPRPGGTLAQIAEAGQAEAVIPLDRLGSLGGPQVVNNFHISTLPGNETATANEIQRILVKHARQKGNAQAVATFSF